MLQGEGGKRQNACSAKAAGAVYLNLNLGRPICHGISGLPNIQKGDEVIWCTSPPPETKQSDRYMLGVTSSVGQLNLGPGGDNARRSQGGENVF